MLLPASFANAWNGGKEGFFPNDEIFKPILADPKEPRFFGSVRHIDNEMRKDFTGAAIGLGETFGIYRKNLGPERAWQLSISGGVFSHFDMDTSTYDLLNSDYNIGLLWTYRDRDASLRFRIYHQSSHIGDDYIDENPALLNKYSGFDYEAAELITAYDWQPFRVYGGIHYLLQRDPGDLDRWSYQAGLEYESPNPILFQGMPVAGVDIKGLQERSWTPAISVKAGLKFKTADNNREIMVLAEYYNGFIPYGAFYDYDMDAFGLGVYFGF
ncbi:MAG: DUF1207 domain-containing protein [Desulfobacterales bacterium]|nr:DUF1207 domain-containing protein [Desulfobacterales bacterium]